MIRERSGSDGAGDGRIPAEKSGSVENEAAGGDITEVKGR